VLWIRPDYYKGYWEDGLIDSLPPLIARRFNWCYTSQFKEAVKKFKLQRQTTILSYIARSGAWTPPWADKMFTEFLELSKADYLDAPNHPFQKIRDFRVPTKEEIETLARKMEGLKKNAIRQM